MLKIHVGPRSPWANPFHPQVGKVKAADRVEALAAYRDWLEERRVFIKGRYLTTQELADLVPRKRFIQTHLPSLKGCELVNPERHYLSHKIVLESLVGHLR